MIERHLKEVHLTGQLGNKLVYLLVLDYIYDIYNTKKINFNISILSLCEL